MDARESAVPAKPRLVLMMDNGTARSNAVDAVELVIPIRSASDIVLVRQATRDAAVELGFGIVDQTKLVTAASELARNTLDYGGGGEASLEKISNGGRRALRLTFADRGPGIPDIEQALRDGYSTGHGLGLGLGGARRLVNEFEIHSVPGQGTRVTITRWQ
jgi:serine/threonine-protein kinase RsbT